jgi:hypothetical protein
MRNDQNLYHESMQSKGFLFCCYEIMNSDECSYPEIVKVSLTQLVLVRTTILIIFKEN